MRNTHNFIHRFYGLFLLLGLSLLVLTIESCEDDDDICPAIECNTGTQNPDTCDCDCPTGFSGVNCQIEDCPTINCNTGTQNADTCDCDCPSGFIGVNCECPVIECNTGVQNPATCSCDCPDGFAGVNCEIDESTLKVRKNAKDMTPQEIIDFVNAVLILKATPSPYSDTLSYYDSFVRFHQMAVEKSKCDGFGVAHTNPAFPPWHRKLLILFEDALSEVSGNDIALPYWDWSDQASTDALFSSAFLGGNGDPNDEYALNDGPFRKDNWQINLFTILPNYVGLNPHPWIVRNFGATIAGSNNYPGYAVSLPTISEIDNCLSITTYDMAPWDCSNGAMPNTSFRFCLEGFLDGDCAGAQAMHNIGHDWIAGFFEVPVSTIEMLPVSTSNSFCGNIARDTVPNNVRVGSMEPLDVSPNDPAFFIHHANVDRIWAQWQDMPGNAENYVPVSGQAGGYNLNDNMYPYDIPSFQMVPAMMVHGDTPASMLDYRALGYKYE
ncbi:tyrosinase family protein [Neolewinella persica]|uniref:tyrosinase family protein n=1 Tax=Neolewinella persica TaxID=70998 RepID=UPI0003714383|nr:tyrosinase family protein [Neolewinella persica]